MELFIVLLAPSSELKTSLWMGQFFLSSSTFSSPSTFSSSSLSSLSSWIYFFPRTCHWLTDWVTMFLMLILDTGQCRNLTMHFLSSSVFDRCEDGEAKISCGYKLPARYVISTVGPMGEHPKVPKKILPMVVLHVLNRCWKMPIWTAWKWWKQTIWDRLPFPAYPPASTDILT